MPHFLRYQGLALDDYDFALDASNLGAPSTFAHLGLNVILEYCVLKFFSMPFITTKSLRHEEKLLSRKFFVSLWQKHP